jgi:hypothetical protein
VIEKLLENWLDSASERSYQAVFVQMLSGMGYRVVHSTRHTALEFGKDVLAVANDGTGCAYQLKGNPGGKLSLSQFRSEVQAQLVQLMSQPVIYPGFPSGPHKAFLVSNGYFEEEVHRAVDDLNRGPYPSKVTLINRGDMLDWSKSMGTLLWPSELADVRLLLELVLSDHKDLLPAEKLSQLLGKVLATDPSDERSVGRPEFHRMVTSAALLTGIGTAHFAEGKNHYAVASAWALLAVMIIAAAEKHGHALAASALDTLDLAEAAALDALAELWEEVSGQTYLIEGNAMTDAEVYGWRYGVLLGALSCLAIAHDNTPLLDEESAGKLKAWLLKTHQGIKLWGEGAIVNLAPWLVYIRKHDPTMRPDLEIEAIAKAVVAMNLSDSRSVLASPYYAFEGIARNQARLDKLGGASGVDRETFAGSAYTAEPLLHLLVRTNRKITCKALWPDFTRLGHRGLLLAEPWHYCLLKVRAGHDETRMYPLTYEWDRLKAEATSVDAPAVSRELLARSWLLAFWWQVAPYRFNSGASRVFAESQIPGWGSK